MVIGFTLSCKCFLLKSRLRRREKQYSLKTSPGVYQTYYHNISFDAEFYDEFEFSFKILISPTHFEKGEKSRTPYEVVPNVRPVILVGPSLKGYEGLYYKVLQLFSGILVNLGRSLFGRG